MKIVLYGVSRSGKNYLIERLAQELNKNGNSGLFHLEGSVTLNEMGQEKYGKKFKHLTETEKDVLRKLFTAVIGEKEKLYNNIIVDGHYAFIDGEDYKTVFTDSDRDAYDSFFYLDTPSDMIVSFSQKTVGEKNNMSITADEISRWKQFEIKNLNTICNKMDKELIILDENTANSIEFISKFIAEKESTPFSAKTIATHMITQNIDKIEKYKKIFVLDCDKTISNNDVTYDFCYTINIDKSKLKENFVNDRYSLYQFFNMAKLYSEKTTLELENACKFAKSKVSINHELIEQIKNECEEYLFIGLTSGVHMVWESIANEICFPQFVLGCDNLEMPSYLVSAQVKYEFVKQLQSMGYLVNSIGDSLIDAPMLEASDNGFIVAHEKLSAGMVTYFKDNESRIKQLSMSSFKYENVSTVKGVK